MKSGVYTVDRIEEGVYVLENRETLEYIDLKKENVPCDLKQGDIVKLSCNRCGRVVEAELCPEETKKALDENAKKLNSLFDN